MKYERTKFLLTFALLVHFCSVWAKFENVLDQPWIHFKAHFTLICFEQKVQSIRIYVPKWSLMVIEAPPSTKTDKFEAWPCSAATCKAVLPSPRGPIQASKSAPA